MDIERLTEELLTGLFAAAETRKEIDAMLLCLANTLESEGWYVAETADELKEIALEEFPEFDEVE